MPVNVIFAVEKFNFACHLMAHRPHEYIVNVVAWECHFDDMAIVEFNSLIPVSDKRRTIHS